MKQIVGLLLIFNTIQFGSFAQVNTNSTLKPLPTIIRTGLGPIFPENPSGRGFADLHCHQFANLAFGGNAFHGLSYGPIDQVLGWCTSKHGPGGAGDVLGNLVRSHLYCTGTLSALGHSVGGYQKFDGWPRWDNLTHQAVYEDWLFRAFKGGLRLMVMHAVNNEFMCGLTPSKASGRTCSDEEAVRLQILAAKDFERYIDNKYGGPGNGWYRIVYSSAEAMGVIKEGRLAVILGVEVDYPLGSYKNNLMTTTLLDQKLEEYYQMGVRQIFPIHFDNNVFGGTAFDKDLDQSAQDLIQDPTKPYKITTTISPWYKRQGGKINSEGLTSIGKYFIRKLMEKGMLIDIDHLSYISRANVFEIAARLGYTGLVSGHGGYVEQAIDEAKSHEGNLLPSEFNWMLEHGGFFAPILNQGKNIREWTAGNTKVRYTCRGSIESFAQAYLYVLNKTAATRAIAIGSDFNGMINAFGPRFGPDACPCEKTTATTYPKTVYPFKAITTGEIMDRSAVGAKIFDINVDGLAHVGMLPDMIADLQTLGLSESDLSPLINSAASYANFWLSAERSAERIRNLPKPVFGTITTDDPADAIDYIIEYNAYHEGKIGFQLCQSNNLTWEKRLNVPNSQGASFTLSVRDLTKCAMNDYDIGLVNTSLSLIFYKAKTLGIITEIKRIPISSLGNLPGGTKVTFTWKKD